MHTYMHAIAILCMTQHPPSLSPFPHSCRHDDSLRPLFLLRLPPCLLPLLLRRQRLSVLGAILRQRAELQTPGRHQRGHAAGRRHRYYRRREEQRGLVSVMVATCTSDIPHVSDCVTHKMSYFTLCYTSPLFLSSVWSMHAVCELLLLLAGVV